MKLILTIAAIFIGNSVFCQNCFEGKVVYNHIMKGIGNSNTTEEVYYRKDGSFVSIHKEQSMKMIYRADNGTIYNIHKLNGKIVIMFDSTYSKNINNTSYVYLDADTVEERICLKARQTINSGKMKVNITSWIDTSINVFNIASPTKRGLDIKAVTSAARLNVNMQGIKKFVSIEEMPVNDTLFELPSEEKIKWIDMLKKKNSDNISVDSVVKEYSWVLDNNSEIQTKYIVETSESSFEQDVESGIALVDFWARWCIPCQSLTPKMEVIAQKYGNEIKVLKVDVDKCKLLAKKYNVQYIPVVIIMKNGKEIGRLVGADLQNTESIIWDKINSIIKENNL